MDTTRFDLSGAQCVAGRRFIARPMGTGGGGGEIGVYGQGRGGLREGEGKGEESMRRE